MKLEDFLKTKDELNPKLWNGFKLHSNVKNKLLQIVKFVEEHAELKKSQIKDILLIGSNTNYNWNNKSDLDLHFLLNANGDCSEDFLELKKAFAGDFNKKYDVKIKGIDIEIYMQGPDESLESESKYSLKYDKWLSIPSNEKDELPEKIEDKIYSDYESLKKKALKLNSPESIDKFTDEQKAKRKASLDKNGESTPNNLAFKMLRSNGIIGKLKDKKYKLISDKLSLK